MFVIKIPYFDLQTIYKSMQSVRIERKMVFDHYAYYVQLPDDVVMIEQYENDVNVFHCNEELFYDVLFNYFGLKIDYGKVNETAVRNYPGYISGSAIVNSGYRVIFPDLWEVTLTQLFSVGNSMMQVKRDVNTLCSVLGDAKVKRYPGKPEYKYNTFPDFERVFIDRDLLKGKVSSGNYKRLNKLCKHLHRSDVDNASIRRCNGFLDVLDASGLYSPRALQSVALNGLRKLQTFPASTYAHDKIKQVFGLNMRDFTDWYLSGHLKNYKGVIYGYLFATDLKDKLADEWEKVLY